MLHVKRFDKAMKSKPVSLVFTGEQRPKRVQNIAVGTKTALNDPICAICLTLKAQLSYIFHRIPDEHEQKKGGWNPDD